jgi:hypothetical protein
LTKSVLKKYKSTLKKKIVTRHCNISYVQTGGKYILGTGVNYPRWGKNKILGGNEVSIKFENKVNLSYFWMSTAAKAFKIVHEGVVKKLLHFATTYLCEQGFSTLMNIKTMQRNRLDPEDSIQFALTSKCPHFDVIV